MVYRFSCPERNDFNFRLGATRPVRLEVTLTAGCTWWLGNLPSFIFLAFGI